MEAVVTAHAVRSLSQPLPAPITLLPPPPPLPSPPALPPHSRFLGTAAPQLRSRESRHRQSLDPSGTDLPAVVMPSAGPAARSRHDRRGSEPSSAEADALDYIQQYGTNVGEPGIMDLLHATKVGTLIMAGMN